MQQKKMLKKRAKNNENWKKEKIERKKSTKMQK